MDAWKDVDAQKTNRNYSRQSQIEYTGFYGDANQWESPELNRFGSEHVPDSHDRYYLDKEDLESGDSFISSTGHSGKGPKGWKMSDERILEELSFALFHHSDLDASEIEVSVKDGVVSLRGLVQDRYSKKEAEYTVEEIPGVIDVVNELKLA